LLSLGGNRVATLRDVALRAGVTPKTVSRVINADPAVNVNTRERIQKLVDEMGYSPNAVARAMRLSSTGVIGFLSDQIATTPLSAEIVRGVQARMRDLGLHLLIANTDRDAALTADYWRIFKQQRVDAAVIATMYHREIAVPVSDVGGPVALLNCYEPGNRHITVLPDDRQGGFLQAEHALALGHRNMTAITLHPDIPATRLRNQGICDAFAAFGVTVPETLFIAGERGPADGVERISYDVAVKVLSAADRPSAILCGNDRVALAVYSAATALCLRIPDDLSVIGFDDFTMISETVRPQLTTVYLPYFEMGAVTIELLGEARRAPSPANDETRQPVLVPCRLVERGSARAFVENRNTGPAGHHQPKERRL
jgi:LacI family transcriptional regulator